MSTPNTRLALAAALFATVIAPTALACKAPLTPKPIPDGRRAEAGKMVEAKRSVEQYLEHVSVYVDCEKDALKLQEIMARQKLVMDRFNAEVRAFNSVARAYKVGLGATAR